MLQHSLFSQNNNMPIVFFDKFDKDVIKNAIVSHLQANPSDTVEHCKEYNKQDIKRYYGNEILNFYEVNPKNSKPSKVITKGDKTYYKSLID